jgi:DNA (cytosine-5)-methyltransferase 1
MTVIDLFAGPGGWDVAAKRLGIDPIGLEWDNAACETRRAAGLRTMKCDIAEVDFDSGWRGMKLDGLIASPPCQGFSMAGKGKGRQDTDQIIAAAHELAMGHDTRSQREWADPRSALVLEPIRWANEFRPRWIALEQVPAVLPLWSQFAQILGTWGYSATCGILNAEQHGVPQTRKRAILVARLDADARLPEPTHSRYYPRKPERLDEGVLPWVSMASALGWDAGGVVNTRGVRRTPGGNEFSSDTPSRALIGKARSRFVTNARANASVRPVGAPAPTITAGHDSGERRWLLTRQVGAQARSPQAPAPTMLAAGLGHGVQCWVEGAGPYKAFDGRETQRVTVLEAATLQSFPPDHPWQGSRTKQFEQVGNAIPPLLAEAVLREVVS